MLRRILFTIFTAFLSLSPVQLPQSFTQAPSLNVAQAFTLPIASLRSPVTSYTSAQTEVVVVSVGSGQLIQLEAFEFTVSKDTTVNVSFLLECEDAGGDVQVAKDSGVAPGSGFVRIGTAADPIIECADGQDLTMTTSAATNGAVDIVVNYQLRPTT